MAMSRLRGGRSVTSRSPMRTRPASGYSRPATQRSSVVFPQPLGPSSTMSSPSAISRSTPSTAVVFPKVLLTVSSVMAATVRPPLVRHPAPHAEQVAADQEDARQRGRQHEPGGGEAERQRRDLQRADDQGGQGRVVDGQDGGGEDLVPRQLPGEDPGRRQSRKRQGQHHPHEGAERRAAQR